MIQTDNKRQHNIDVRYNDIYTRSYKLAAAIFIVLKVVEGEDSLKIRIKDLCLDTMSLCSGLKDFDVQLLVHKTKAISQNVRETGSILQVMFMSGLISEMNARILNDALSAFFDSLDQYVKEISTFTIDDVVSSDNLDFSLKNIKNQASSKFEQVGNKVAFSAQLLTSGSGKKNIGLRKNTRQESILSIVAKNNGVGIKDIMPEIKGCSEKTVQRELLTLVEEGKVIKEGDRRWSKYYMAK